MASKDPEPLSAQKARVRQMLLDDTNIERSISTKLDLIKEEQPQLADAVEAVRVECQEPKPAGSGSDLPPRVLLSDLIS